MTVFLTTEIQTSKGGVLENLRYPFLYNCQLHAHFNIVLRFHQLMQSTLIGNRSRNFAVQVEEKHSIRYDDFK